MLLNEMLVNENWAAAGGEAEYKRPFNSGIECFDPFYACTLMACLIRKGAAGVCTNDVVRDVLGRSLGVVANDQPPISGKRTVEYRRALALAYMMVDMA